MTEREEIRIVPCLRCGLPCRSAIGNPEARLLRKTTKPGFCVDCATTLFLKATVPMNTVIETRGPEILLDTRFARQFVAVMFAGSADAKPEEISWERVVANWNLPEPNRVGHAGGA